MNGPGIALIVAGAIGVLQGLFGIGQFIVGRNQAVPPEIADNPQAERFYEMFMKGGIIVPLIMLALAGLILAGGIQMRQLRNYGLATAAAIAAIIPCCGPCYGCVGIPLGIWALVVLMKPEVKASFTA